MKNKEQHFPDTNVLLSPIIDEDSQDAEYYLENVSDIFLSNTVCEESEEVLNKLKEVSLLIDDFIYNYSMNKHINAMKINSHKSKIKNDFLKQYCDEEYPEDFKKSKFNEITSKFFIEHEIEINEILLGSNDEKLISIIKDKFKKDNVKLNNIITPHTCLTFTSSPIKYEDFKKLGAHYPDTLLLDEAYKLHIMTQKPVYFDTFDNDVLDIRDSVLKYISHNLFISHPCETITINLGGNNA